MQFKSIFVVLCVAVLLASQADALLKFKLLKAKLLAAKAPHVLAHLAVAKDVKVKTGIAWAKSIAAVKAVNKATFSLATAPIRVAKKTIALKIAGLKAAKALKLAKAVAIIKTLKKHPIIVPVPVPVKVPFPVFGKKDGLKGAAAAVGLTGAAAAGLTGAAAGLLGPVSGLITGAQSLLSRGAGTAGLSSLLNFGGAANLLAAAPQHQPIQDTVYRFVPGTYNNIQYTPTINVEVPHNAGVSVSAPGNTYGLPLQHH